MTGVPAAGAVSTIADDPRADRVGRVVAILCAVHCAAPPLLLALAAAAGAAGVVAWGSASVERLESLDGWFAVSALLAATGSLWRHRHDHARATRALWFALGLGLLIVGRPWAESVGIAEWVVGLVAGGALLVGHARRPIAAGTERSVGR